VPGAGIEPARPSGHGILSPERLPVPPPRRSLIVCLPRSPIPDPRSPIPPIPPIPRAPSPEPRAPSPEPRVPSPESRTPSNIRPLTSALSPNPHARVPHFWSALLFYSILTIALAYPLSIHPGSSVVSDDPDAHLFIWTLAWDTHAITHQPLSIFEANIFYPEHRTLAYSENMLGAAIFAAPIIWLTDNPVLAMNIVALLSCVLCGVGAYVLAQRLGLGTEPALICGIIFAFAPARFFRLSQIHLTTVQWIPFALASLHAYFSGGGKRELWLAAAFVILQILTSGHGAVFIGIACGGYVLWQLLVVRPRTERFARDAALPVAVVVLISVLTFMPYVFVQREMGLKRSLVGWAPTPESFLASPTHLHAWILSHVAPDVIAKASGFLFPGYLPLMLAAAAFGPRFFRSGPLVPRRATLFFLAFTVVCLLLAAGPPIGVWPLVYWLPGFNFIRAPARFAIPAVLGIAVLASIGFAGVARSLSRRSRNVATVACAMLLLGEFAAVPIRHAPYELSLPMADRWLNDQRKPFVVAEVPVNAYERSHSNFMLHSMAHWQKTVHGYSGMRPPLHEKLYAEMRAFPDNTSVMRLAQLGVTYVVVHGELYPPDTWPQIEAKIGQSRLLALVFVAGRAKVYEILPPEGGSHK
jgi:hypothetical protein